MSYGYDFRPGSVVETYPVVMVRAERKGRCPVCHGRVTRRTTFENTESPFNKASDGHVRTREEIRAKLRADAEAWEPDFRHAACIHD